MGYLRLTLDGVTLAEISVVREQAPAPSGFFVSPSGSDSNPGTLAAPWRTVGKAMSTLVAGQTAYVRAGTYSEGSTLTWSRDGTAAAPITIAGYPGELAEIVGTKLVLSGDYVVAKDLTVRDLLAVDQDGFGVSGRGCRVEHCRVTNTARHGILLNTSARDVVIARNYVRDCGNNSSNSLPDHGIYVQGLGHQVWSNNFYDYEGYGIHVYGTGSTNGPSNVVVAHNTALGSRTGRGGILLRSEQGTNITAVNNIFDRATWHTCLTPRLVDTNLVWPSGWQFQEPGSPTNTIQADPRFVSSTDHRLQAGSPAIGAARADYSFPDLDGNARVSRCLGAYEV